MMTNAGPDVGNGGHYSLPMATNWSNTVQLGVEMPQKVKNRSIHDAAILLLGIYSKDSMSYC